MGLGVAIWLDMVEGKVRYSSNKEGSTLRIEEKSIHRNPMSTQVLLYLSPVPPFYTTS